MAESDGRNDPERTTSGGPTSSSRPVYRRSKNNRQCDRNKKDHVSTFRGPLVGYESQVYDIFRNRGSDAFSTTTRKSAEYISRTVSNAGEFMNAINPDDLGNRYDQQSTNLMIQMMTQITL